MVDLLYYFYTKNKLSQLDIQYAYQDNFIPKNSFKEVMRMIYDRQQRDLDIIRGK